jgi:PAS domain S-box-containing protein
MNIPEEQNKPWQSNTSELIDIKVDTFIVSMQGTILSCSPTLCSLHNLCAVDIIGSDFLPLFSPLLDPLSTRQLVSFIADGKQHSFGPVFGTDPANQSHYQFSGTIIEDNFVAEKNFLFTVLTFDPLLALHSSMENLQSELADLIKMQERRLEEATTSLIETNVALRREIREHRSVLHALTESESRFRDLTEATSDFIWEIDQEANYTYASPKSRKLFGIAPEELMGKSFLMLCSPEGKARYNQIHELTKKLHFGYAKVEYSYVKPDGRDATIESSGEPIFSHRHVLIGFRGIDRDVTERRIYEQMLREAKEAAETASIAKSEFLANMSHELRTPLHAILSFAKYGEKRIASASKEDLLRFFQQITVSGQRLLPLINSLLDLARLQAGKMKYDFQPLDIITELQSAVFEFTPLAEKKDIAIRIVQPQIPTIAYCDASRIGQVIRNLLANAIQFSDPQTTIIFVCSRYQDSSNEMLQVTVENRGVIIPREELSTIFEKFVQSSATKSGAGGTGLGLAICSQIIKDHSGTIWASHGPAGESRFHFTLPRHPAEIRSIP